MDPLLSVQLSEFLLFMQNKGVWPCHLFIGEDPQQLTPEEVFELKTEFVKSLTPERDG